MIPIRELLNRIRWDPAWAASRFSVGYYDRIARCVITVPLERIELEPGNRFFFHAIEADGSAHEVPFHRVREVRRDGELIWRRATRAASRR